jgi:hypothetical protein
VADKKDDKLPEFSTLDGHEILVPPHALRPSARMRLTSVLEPLMGDGAESTNLISLMADVMEVLEGGGYIRDDEAWDRFYDDAGLEDVVNLVMAYSGEAAGAKN